MNDFESTLTTALHTRAEETAAVVDITRARGELAARLDRADHTRHRNLWLTAGAIAAAAAVVAAIALASHPTRRANDLPPTGPSPTQPTGPSPSTSTATVAPPFALAANPFLTNADWAGLTGGYVAIVKTDAAPRWMTKCVTNPVSWGAVETRTVKYVQRPKAPINEYLLRYADQSSAHRALAKAKSQIANCLHQSARPRDVKVPAGHAGPIDEFFYGSAEPSAPGGYAILIARDSNVVVVIETTGWNERGTHTLEYALQRAIPSERGSCTARPCLGGS